MSAGRRLARWIMNADGDGRVIRFEEPADVDGMRYPVRCTWCSHVYDLAGRLPGLQQYTDCSVWRCPGCGAGVSNRPEMIERRYTELDENGLTR